MRKPIKRLTSGVIGVSNIDPEIKDLVYSLNRSGYRTINSCAGDTYATAMVSFREDISSLSEEDKKELREIIRQYTDVPFHILRNSIIFRSPLGGLPEWITPEGQPGWKEELVEHVSKREELESLLREEKESQDFWT